MVWGVCSVDLPSAAVVVFSARDVLCRPRHCQPSSPPFLPETWHLGVLTGLRVTLPLISMHESSREGSQPSLFQEEQEARCIPAATGHWVVSIEAGAHGSSSLSPDWWMACLTLSEQDGRCVGCVPEIVTPDCFIRAWLIELSSSWCKVPRHLVQPFPPSCLSRCHPRTLACLPACLTGLTPASHPPRDRYINKLV